MRSLPNELLTVTAVNECLDACPNSLILELSKVSRLKKCQNVKMLKNDLQEMIKDFYKRII